MVNLRDQPQGDKIDSILFSTSENTAISYRCSQSIRYSWEEQESRNRKKRFQLYSSLGSDSVWINPSCKSILHGDTVDSQHSQSGHSKPFPSLWTFLKSLEAAKSRSCAACPGRSSVGQVSFSARGCTTFWWANDSFFLAAAYGKGVCSLRWLWEILELLFPSDVGKEKCGTCFLAYRLLGVCC